MRFVLVVLSLVISTGHAMAAQLSFDCQFQGAVRQQYRKTVSGNFSENSGPINVKVLSLRNLSLIADSPAPAQTNFESGDSMAVDYFRFDLNEKSPDAFTQFFLAFPKVITPQAGLIFNAALDEIYDGGKAGWNRFELACKTKVD